MATALSTSSTHAANEFLYRRLPYDPVRDFECINILATAPLAVIAAPCVLVTRVTGPGTEAILQCYMTAAERAMQAGPLRVFHDWTGMTRYDPAARDTLKRWGRAHHADFVCASYLVESKVIAMLVSVAALTLGRDLRATTDRDGFEREVTSIPRRTGQPTGHRSHPEITARSRPRRNDGRTDRAPSGDP